MRSTAPFTRRWLTRSLLASLLTGGAALAQVAPVPVVPLLESVDPSLPIPPIPKHGEPKATSLPKVDVPSVSIPEIKLPTLKAPPTSAPGIATPELPSPVVPEPPLVKPEVKTTPEVNSEVKAIPEVKPEMPTLPSLPTQPNPNTVVTPEALETLPMPHNVSTPAQVAQTPLAIPVPPPMKATLPKPTNEMPLKLPPIPELPKKEAIPSVKLPSAQPKTSPWLAPTPITTSTTPPTPPTPAPGSTTTDPALPLGAPPVQPNPVAQPTGPSPLAPTMIPEEKAKDSERKATPACAKCGFDFSKTPQHVRPQPRPGFFQILPTGRGYYSLMDAIQGNVREAPPKVPFPRFALMPPSFFDADWRYLDDPKNKERDLTTILKRMPIGQDFMLSVGGASWIRYMQEENSRLTRIDNNYTLHRHRAYSDLWYKDLVRVYVEGIFADTTRQALAPLPIDSTGFDLLNAFMDVKVVNFDNKPVYLRAGRQEILLGSQRLVSTLDWANTRRTFEGFRLTRTGEKWDFDAFWLQPVLPNANRFDRRDSNVNFAGAWTTYRPDKNRLYDFYNLILDNNNSIVQNGLQRGRYTLNTLGSRYAGSNDAGILWDIEGAFQFGEQLGRNVTAGMATAGVGYHANKLPWSPIFWAYYDWASGTDNPGAVASNTFNQLFPFGHYYLGWADQVGRQNIQSLNFHAYAYPAKWVTLWAQYHSFWLNSSTDGLYNVAGNIIRRDPTGRAGVNVGQEVDLVANFHLTNNQDMIVGYSYLFGGDFLKRTAGPNRGVDSSLFFAMYSLRW